MNIGCVAFQLGPMGIVTDAVAIGESDAGLEGERAVSYYSVK